MVSVKECGYVQPSQENVNIRLELVGEQAKKFEELKKLRGLKNNCELVRQLIIEAIRRELPSKLKTVAVTE
jgi:hypothetical protein